MLIGLLLILLIFLISISLARSTTTLPGTLQQLHDLVKLVLQPISQLPSKRFHSCVLIEIKRLLVIYINTNGRNFPLAITLLLLLLVHSLF